MRKIVFASFLLIIMFTLVACSPDSNTTNPVNETWQVNLLSYQLTNWVDSDISGYGYQADDGYTWLLINIRMKNLTNETQSINWLLSTFKYISENDNIYDLRLQYNDPPGYIDTYYNPGQEKEGFIAFEVPENIIVTKGRLLWKPENGEESQFNLKNLPGT